VLHTGEDVVFIDFEGDSKRPLAERTLKTTPLVDIGSMLHSFRYLGARATSDHQIPGSFAWDRRHQEFTSLVDAWVERSSKAFLTEYRDTLSPTVLVPADEADYQTFLHSCVVSKAVYQIAYEAQHRPEWLPVAMKAFLDLTRERL
jgi:maltose alpha-D-glucosyltransferase/alpha-amylase